jgi:hypothetical protein
VNGVASSSIASSARRPAGVADHADRAGHETPSAAGPAGSRNSLLACAPVSISGIFEAAVAYCLVNADAGAPVAQTISACAPTTVTWLSTALNSVVVVWNSSRRQRDAVLRGLGLHALVAGVA